MEFALVAGELSGDALGAGLIAELKRYFPDAEFYGIGGEQMAAQGFQSWFPLEKLSVMGFTEVIAHLPQLLGIRRALSRRLHANPPALFIGIDAPEFNLGLEYKLRRSGIPTVHYVSPQVWAWRRWRARKILRATDLVLTLFPFEAEFFRQRGVRAQFIGHPLADDIALYNDANSARHALCLPRAVPLVALLPGSRIFEVSALAPLFLTTAQRLLAKRGDLKFVVAAAKPEIRCRLEHLITHRYPQLPVTLIHGKTTQVLSAADVVLLASGTATLETLLVKKPMVVAYRLAPLSAWLARRLVKSEFFALPNLLAQKRLVEEFFQEQATPQNLAAAVLALLDDRSRCMQLETEFLRIHRMLRQDANRQAAAALVSLIDGSRSPAQNNKA